MLMESMDNFHMSIRYLAEFPMQTANDLGNIVQKCYINFS